MLPKLLLIATALSEPALAGRGPPVGEELPLGVAEGTERVDMVDPERASGALAATFEDLQRVHGHPKVATYFRALGQWPSFLEWTWARLRPVVGTEPYVARRAQLLERARELVLGMPFVPVPPRGSGLDVAGVLAVFRERVVPDLLLDVTAIKALLDGAEAARTSRFSGAGAQGH